ncbi:MAG: pyridoxamine 5'-phosphate oxidase family protein [Eubacteriaceae bacterium]|jgi:nitroimidazol reductase NimA-like FMN-containing flavoprotein (pyridoxamine 5'-phosphate oxidase superfamily)|nr:pyridoxamine 5'-phosphate oxidase family protein [Eubacteriaceae bacterium]
MFREMRRKKQLLSEEEAEEILLRGTAGVLAVMGDDGYPYGVPVSYVYEDGKIIFHSARAGHKIDAIIRDPKVSFTVIDMDCIVPEEYTTYFRSAVAFGRAAILKDDNEKREALLKLAAKYSPEYEEGREKEADQELKNVCMVEITIDHLTGKEAIELVRKKKS